MESFVTQLGHDLRTPLTPLFALIPLIRKRIADPELLTMIDICQESVVTVHALTERALKLVSLSASNTGALQRLNLSRAVARYLAAFGEQLEERGLTGENGVDPRIAVTVLPEQLRELFANLISNALRHSPAGGVIRIAAAEAEGEVTVSVRDQGAGVQPADLERIFDEFFKVDASRHDLASTGLGLAICRRIVANHRGRIWAESDGPGCGLTVRFTLPVQSDVASHEHAEEN